MNFRTIRRESVNPYERSVNCEAAGSRGLVISSTWRNIPYTLPENAIDQNSAPPHRRRLACPVDTSQVGRVPSDVARGAEAKGLNRGWARRKEIGGRAHINSGMYQMQLLL